MIFVRDIKAVVAEEFGISIADLEGSSRLRKFTEPRSLAASLSYEMTRQGLTGVGRLFGGRHHTTILCARRSINARLRSDPELRQRTRRVLRQLRRSA